MKTLTLILLSSLLLIGCVGSKEGLIEASREETIKGIREVAKNVQMSYKQGDLDVNLIIGSENVSKQNQDIFLSKTSTNTFNNTSTFGTIKLKSITYNETFFDATFTSPAGDPWANANLIYEMTKQQININRGVEEPFINPLKSTNSYVLLTAISPILSANYLLNENPLVSKSNHKWVYLQSGFGDLTMIGLLIAGASAKNKQYQYFWTGIAFSIIWKLVSLLSITDINDYNIIARSPYNLSKIECE